MNSFSSAIWDRCFNHSDFDRHFSPNSVIDFPNLFKDIAFKRSGNNRCHYLVASIGAIAAANTVSAYFSSQDITKWQPITMISGVIPVVALVMNLFLHQYRSEINTIHIYAVVLQKRDFPVADLPANKEGFRYDMWPKVENSPILMDELQRLKSDQPIQSVLRRYNAVECALPILATMGIIFAGIMGEGLYQKERHLFTFAITKNYSWVFFTAEIIANIVLREFFSVSLLEDLLKNIPRIPQAVPLQPIPLPL